MANYKSAMIALAFSTLLIASLAESRLVSVGFGRSGSEAISCDKVYGAEQDDTCISVAQKFKLDENTFLSINPNINCDKIFVGQWLCVNTKA